MSNRRRPYLTLLLVAFALVLYWLMAVSASRRMGVTADEVVHLTGGYSYWTLNDYRLHPENGNLAQRIASLPLLAMDLAFPSIDDPHWLTSKVNLVGEKFFFHLGNNVERMLLFSRMMIGLCGAFVVWLTWRWAKGLFGPTAGWLALALAVFCPAFLAHGALATSDMVMTGCTLAALSAVWLLLHRVTWPRLVLAALACGLAFLSKMSGVILVPVIVVLVIVRSLHPAPLLLALGRPRLLRKTSAKLLATTGLMSAVALGSLAVLWAGFGFRYSGFNPNHAPASGYWFSWDVVLSKTAIDKYDAPIDRLLPDRKPPEQTSLDHLVEWTRDHRLLPEAYLWGFAQTNAFSRYRPAYLMGQLGTTGWVEFFPLAFLLKTTPAALILGLTALAALIGPFFTRCLPASPRARTWAYRATPLIVFFALYWCMALSMNLNIGHRHILPTYPVFYVLASASALWLTRPSSRFILIGLIVAGVLHSGESLMARPFYLSYFQAAVGGSDRGYKYLVDSSSDWGQGLPDLEKWLASKKARGDSSTTHLCYFGADSPRARKLDVVRFGDEISDNGLRVYPAPLKAGWYIISATNFVQAYMPTRGPWTRQKESLYVEILQRLQSPQARHSQTDSERKQVLSDCMDLELLQASRLFLYLQNRTPETVIGGSLLVIRLTDDEIREALYTPWRQP